MNEKYDLGYDWSIPFSLSKAFDYWYDLYKNNPLRKQDAIKKLDQLILELGPQPEYPNENC